MRCTSVGLPFNNVDIGQPKPLPTIVVIQPETDPAKDPVLPPDLQSTLDLGHLRRAVQTASVAVTSIPFAQPSNDPILPPNLKSSLDLGLLPRALQTETPSTAAPVVTAAASLPRPPQFEHKDPIINRRVERREQEPHAWCEEGQLVISEQAGHSAVQVCESSSSWGPDFISLAEGICCDMCA